MAITVPMPQLGESVTEGTVGSWLKNVGDRVERYDPLLEVISDKVDTEITAPEPGTLLSILVQEGETVPVGTPLCVLGEEGDAPEGDSAPAAAAPEPEAEPQPVEAEPEPEPEPEPQPMAAEPEPQSAVAAPEADTESVIEGELIPEPAAEAGSAARSMSPVVARMVSEHRLDISAISGTGRDGRVTKSDVEAYLDERRRAAMGAVARPDAAPTPPAAPTPSAVPTPAHAPAERSVAPVPPAARPAPAPTPAPARTAPAMQAGELIPLTNMRRRIAEHMVNAKRNAPHVTTVFEADLSAITAHREHNKRDFEARGARLTFMAYFVEAIAHALRAHPLANATFTEEGIQLFRDVNIGMAAATEGGAGLLVPVIKRADEKNLLGIARDVWDLTQRSRSGGLTPDDMSGGTFTITNHGVGGSLWGTPIINQGQAGIVGIGKIQKRVVVTPDDAIAVRPMAYLSFTMDHRGLDGASADAFMSEVVAFLEGYE